MLDDEAAKLATLWNLYFDAAERKMLELAHCYFMSAFRLGRELERARNG